MKGYTDIMQRFYSLDDELQNTVNEIALKQFAKKVEDRISAWEILEIVDKVVKK